MQPLTNLHTNLFQLLYNAHDSYSTHNQAKTPLGWKGHDSYKRSPYLMHWRIANPSSSRAQHTLAQTQLIFNNRHTIRLVSFWDERIWRWKRVRILFSHSFIKIKSQNTTGIELRSKSLITFYFLIQFTPNKLWHDPVTFIYLIQLQKRA